MNKIIRIIAACIWVLLAMPAALAVPSDIPEVLTQPSIVTPKALKAVMLAIANAGPRLVAVGERGIILLSDDNGKTWHQVPTPVQVSLVAVRFVNAHTGWAVGSLGVVLHTSDGGETWSKQLDGIQAAAIVARAAVTPEQQTAAKRLVHDGPDKPFLDLYFKDELNGYIIGAYNLIFRTIDGGKSWQTWQQHVKNPRGWDLYGIRHDGGELFIAGEQGTLLRSHDDGATFEPIASPYKGSYFGLVVGKDGKLVIFGLRGNAFWSGDLGHSWKKIDTGSTVTISAGIRLTDGTLVLVNEAGDLLISHDNGRHFQLQSGKENLPVAGIAEANDGSLIVVGLRGIKHLAPLAAVTQQ